MDFMAEYGSDDDTSPGELENKSNESSPPTNLMSAPTTTLPEAVPAPAPTSSQQPAKKKKKKLDISFLPQSIQDGLMRGVGDIDSDDDQPAVKAAAKDSAESKPTEPRPIRRKEVEETDPLLKLLSSVPMQKGGSNSYFESASKPAKKPISALPPTQRAPPAQPVMTASYKPNPVRSASAGVEVQSTAAANVTIDWSQISTSVPSYAYPSTNFGEMQANEEHSSTSNRKRKERDLELKLQSGDLSTLEQLPVCEVQGFNQWDSHAYMDQQRREAQIMNQYTNNGAMKSIAQPTKLQNRRHQLSSLALKAAETEINLLESRAARGKTKSQTQNKYGW